MLISVTDTRAALLFRGDLEDFARANDLDFEPLRDELLRAGDQDVVRLGGGAAPLVLVHRGAPTTWAERAVWCTCRVCGAAPGTWCYPELARRDPHPFNSADAVHFARIVDEVRP